MCGDVRDMFSKAMPEVTKLSNQDQQEIVNHQTMSEDEVDEDNPSKKSTNQNISIDSLNYCKQYDDDGTGEDQTIDVGFNNVNKANDQNVNVIHVKQSSNELCNLNNIELNNLNTAEDVSSTIDLFSKPKSTDINTFFKCHPIQPFNNILFNPLIAYHRNIGPESHKREWLTYNVETKMFYCSFCIVFAKEINRYVLGCDSSISNNPYERIKEHEKSVNHYQCTEAFLMHSQAKDILGRFTERKRIEVLRKRAILERIIECIKFIGKRGLSYRGSKNAESAYTLGDQNLDHGNFLEALLLVAKFDPVLKTHIDEVVIKSSKHHERNSGVGRPGNFVTLLSKTTADYIIESIGKLMKTHIVKDLQKAQFFSVQIDSTQDVNIHDQLSIVVRYVTDKVNERLIAVVNSTSDTGKNLCDTVCKVMTDLGIDMKKCIGSSTDGASNMRGQYNGFKAWMEKEALGQVHVWCYAHVLNLVMIDTTKVSVQSISLFGVLNSCAVFIRESYLRMAKWEETSKYKTISFQ